MDINNTKLLEEILGIAVSTGADFAEIYWELTRNGAAGSTLLPITPCRAWEFAHSSALRRYTALPPIFRERDLLNAQDL